MHIVNESLIWIWIVVRLCGMISHSRIVSRDWWVAAVYCYVLSSEGRRLSAHTAHYGSQYKYNSHFYRLPDLPIYRALIADLHLSIRWRVNSVWQSFMIFTEFHSERPTKLISICLRDFVLWLCVLSQNIVHQGLVRPAWIIEHPTDPQRFCDDLDICDGPASNKLHLTNTGGQFRPR